MSWPRREPASFRDPSGFLFTSEDGQLRRQVNRSYEAEYRLLLDSGLYQELSASGLLVQHEEVGLSRRFDDQACTVIRPKVIPYISYPYEWSFSQLKEAALLTLEVQTRALARGMTLKDSSAYNVQFEGMRPVLIDTLSFERYQEGLPWVAYRQFCQHFLAPLALMSTVDVRLNGLMRVHIDGLPLDFASAMLPWTKRLRPGLALHLSLHGWLQKEHVAPSTKQTAGGRVTRRGLLGLVDSLKRCVDKLSWRPSQTVWAKYYAENSYTSESLEQKKRVVSSYLRRIRPGAVWDLGANTGLFSRAASQTGAYTVAFDADPACVEMNFLACRQEKQRNILPLCLDLTNPSPAIGWAHQERGSFMDRGPVDAVMALALIHHLSICNNVPFDRLAELLHELCRYLIVEFVPKDDPQTVRLLQQRKDVFSDYSEPAFRDVFHQLFKTLDSTPLKDSDRVLYLMEAKR